MIYREIGKTGMKASVVSLGAWAAGGDAFWGKKEDDRDIVRAIREGIDKGINLIDTAPAYGFGYSEQLVGQAVKGIRNKVFLATKCGLWFGDDEGTFYRERDGKKIYINLSPRAIKIDMEESLKNLQTDYIDLYITHVQSSPPFFTPISETMEALLTLKKEGKIRAIGISNVTAEQVKTYVECGRIDAIQEKYSMLNRVNVEQNLLSVAEKHELSLMAYSPLEQGLLTGKFTMNYVVELGSVRNNSVWYKLDNRKKVIDVLNGWSPLCEKYNCTLTHLVIAWTTAQYDKMYVLCGGRKSSHIDENVKAGDLILDAADIAGMRVDIEALSDPQ